MRRGTTPVITFNTDLDLSEVEELFVTFSQNGETIVEKNKEEVVIDDSKIIVSLSQKDTLKFSLDSNDIVSVQIRTKFKNETAVASNILKIRVKEILKDGEI